MNRLRRCTEVRPWVSWKFKYAQDHRPARSNRTWSKLIHVHETDRGGFRVSFLSFLYSPPPPPFLYFFCTEPFENLPNHSSIVTCYPRRLSICMMCHLREVQRLFDYYSHHPFPHHFHYMYRCNYFIGINTNHRFEVLVTCKVLRLI